MKLRLTPLSAAVLTALFPVVIPLARAADHDSIELISPGGEHRVLQPGDRVVHPGAGIAVNVKGANNQLSGAGVAILAGTAGDTQPSRAVSVEDGGVVTLTDGSTIDIQGDEAIGVRASAGGRFQMRGGSLTTRGGRAHGLSATGAGSHIAIRDGTIHVDGTQASGVLAERGAEVMLEGTTVSNTALATESAAALFIGWEGRILATDSQVVADNGRGIVVQGGHLSFTGGSIEAASDGIVFSEPFHPASITPPPSTAEIRDARIHSHNGIALNINSGTSEVALDNVAIHTDGAVSPAVWITSEAASVVARNGTRIASTGNYGSGVDIRAGRFEMETGSITTHGNNARGLLMVEIYAGSGGSGTSTLRDVAIETFGSNSHGAWTRKAGFDAFLHGGMITTHGDSAHGLAASGGGTITSDLTRVQTEADNAYGLNAFSTGRIQADGLQVSTQGTGAHGAVASGDGSRISLTGGSVDTEGENALGLSAIGGGRIEADGVRVVTMEKNAHGAYLRGNGSELLLRDVDITARGAGSDAIRMDAWDGPAHARVVDSSIHSLQGNGIALYDGARLEVERSRIRNEHNYRSGVFIQGDGNRISLLDTVIESDGIQGIGLWNAGADSEAVITGGTITTHGDFGYGVLTQVSRPGASARVSLRDVAIETFGNTAFGMLATDSQVSVEGGSITTHGDGAGGIIFERLTSPLSLVGTTIDTYGGCTSFYCADALLFAGEAHLDGARLYAHGTGTRGIWSYRTDGGDNRLTLTGGARVETANGTALLVTGSGLSADLSDTTVIGRSANGNGLLLRVEALDNQVIAPSVIEAGHVQLNARRSWLEGDVWLDSGSADLDLRDHSTLTGTLWDNAGRHVGRLALDDGSRWNLRGPSTLGQLQTTGTVSFTGAGFSTLDIVGNLDGAGLFEMRTDLAAGRGDLLRVGGTVSGTHRVLIANSGAEPGSEGGFLEIIRTEGGDGTFQLANIGQAVDVGTYRYTLHTSDRVGGRNSDWSLINTDRLDPPKPPEPPVEPPVTPPEPPVEPPVTPPEPPVEPPVTPPEPPVEPPVTPPEPPVEPPVTPPEPPVEPPVTPPEPPVEPPVTPPEPPVEPPVTPPEPPIIRPPNPGNLSTTANAAIDTSAASTLQAIWYAEAGSLVKRVGERRAQQKRDGAWVRGWAEDQQLDNQGGRPFDQTVRGAQVGSDRAFAIDGGRWHLGGVAGYSQTERRFGGEGTGRTRSYHLGGYATFLADDGWYFDALLKHNRFDSRFNVIATDGRSVQGTSRQNGTGLAMETGRQWRFGDGWFLEPQAGMTLLHINGDAYRTSNGMRVKADGGNSLQLRTSALLGRHIPLADGGFVQPYLKLGEVREFDGRSTVRTNDIATRTDLSGPRTEYGLGVTGSVNGRHHLYADVERAEGDRLDKPWSINLGYRLNW